ncbi:MAG TPA: hypothetical protein VGI75_07290 [Pirellulales bacterium]
MNRGKLLIFFMFASAAAVSGYAIWYRHQESRIVLQHMPPGVAAVIAYPMQAQLQRLIPAPGKEAAANLPSPAEIIRVGGKTYWVVEQKDAMNLVDFATVRGWFLHNDNFDWTEASDPTTNNWQYGITFSNQAGQTQLLFDLNHCEILIRNDGSLMNPRPMLKGLKSFFAEQFPEQESKPPAAASDGTKTEPPAK